jgi:hypothetical protein
MAQKTYSVYNSSATTGDEHFIIQIGKSHIVLMLGSANKLNGFEYYSIDGDLEESLSEIKDQSLLLDKTYSETKVYYNLEEAVLVPVGFFNTSIAPGYLDLAFGNNPGSRINFENVNVNPGIVNVYRSNEGWSDIITHHFRAVTKRHLYSKLVEQALSSPDAIHVTFYKDEMLVIAVKQQQLQLIQSFSYQAAEDIVYHLLNTCKQTDTEANETNINVSGLIDIDSNNYKLLKKYFPKLKLQNTDTQLQQNEYPLHYFTPFFNLLA